MFGTVLVACLVLLEFVHLDLVFAGRQQRLLRYYGQHDALLVVRCEAHCWQLPNRNPCVKACLSRDIVKPGACPRNDSTLSPFASVCMDTCQQDGQCPALTKCCRHHCGVTCQPPENLDAVQGLPEIPTDIVISEGRKKRSIYLEWKATAATDNNVLYAVEERHYTGRHFIESRMSDWSICFRSPKPSHILRHFVKPGRWYQFRVAAVNENGTKGFSPPSVRFSISAGPKPPKAPQGVKVGPLMSYNGSLSAEVMWTPPPSDLPIQKYKIFWSRRLHGATALDSVLVHQHTVSKDQTKFVLHDLQPNSLYFLQIQALVQFGKERLKGEKSGLVLNTTSYMDAEEFSDDDDVMKNHLARGIEEVHLQKLFWSQGELRAKVVWKARRKALKYTVSWWSGPCRNVIDGYDTYKLSATTKASYFDLYDLQFECRYRVSIREVTPEGMKSMENTSITFTTPTCTDFKARYKLVKCRNV